MQPSGYVGIYRRSNRRAQRPVRGRSARRLFGLPALVLAACGGDVTPPSVDVPLLLELRGLRPLDPLTEGTYEGWVIVRGGEAVSAGRFDLPADGRVTLINPTAAPQSFLLTAEPPGDDDASPSDLKLLGGRFSAGDAVLDVTGSVTSGVALEPAPGTHVLFTPSDNAELGYPSHEDGGIWLFNIKGDTLDGSFFLTFTPLARGWIYEGWMVRDWGSAQALWLSYGKFEPDVVKKVRKRDDTGLGPFSGQLQYRDAMPDEIVFPGDDWLANPHGYPVPADLILPVDLNGCFRPPAECEAAGHEYGPSRWTHVISIEPRSELGENPWEARPFLVHPYRNAVGNGPPEEARTILYHPEGLPGGTVRLIPDG